MTKDEALKLALDALETLERQEFEYKTPSDVLDCLNAITAIKEVLAQPEPWEKFCDSSCVWTDHHPDCKLAQRTWVGLTDEDMKDPKTRNFDFIYGARWAEAKLKEKNT